MTIIIIKGSQIAADGGISDNGVWVGSQKKILAVPDIFGGGFISGCGDSLAVDAHIFSMVKMGRLASSVGGEYHLVWINSDGDVFEADNDNQSWIAIYDAEFHAFGAGHVLALGALHSGADIEAAVELCCEVSQFCRGPVQVESIMRKGD